MSFQNSASTDLLIINNSGNVVVAGTGQFSSLVNNTTIYNSGGNASLKIQGNTKVRRLEARTDGTFYLLDESDIEVFHFRSDRQVDFQNDLNCYGTGYYVNGVFVASSEKIKKNIKDIPKTEIFKSLSLKQYDKLLMTK